MSPLFCGTGNFQPQEHDEEFRCSSPVATPRKSRSPCATPRKSKKSSKDAKNPYASRGLDKFSALLTELDEKRQKIYSKMGADEKTLVRFAYSSSNDCIPIVVKLKDQKQERSKIGGDIKEKPIKKNTVIEGNKLSVVSSGGAVDQKETKLQQQQQQQQQQPKLETEKKKVSNLPEWRRPYYMPVAIILILLFMIFGKSFAILCTSLGWYLVPALVPKTPMKKKKLAKRRSSEPKMMTEFLSPTRNHNVQEQEPHRKSF